jgi:hypothetical protein
MKSLKWIAVLICAGVAVGATYAFAVVPYQRELFLTATKQDVVFYDGVNLEKIVFKLSVGQSVNIIRCKDTKHYFEPLIRLDSGRIAHFRSGEFEVVTKPTGWLSRPRYLGCGEK